ncbi:MAG: histidine kinase [Paenibacillus sp.]|nr:histidine kinase [Paenibacillus sp.]
MSNYKFMKIFRDYPLVKYMMMSSLFVVLLLGFRWLWHELNPIPKNPPIEQGMIDLSHWDFDNPHSMLLNGEWAFYPGQLEGEPIGNPKYVQVPGSWSEGMPEGAAYGSGTYKLTIMLGDEQEKRDYGFWFKRIESASQVEVNGENVPAFGRLGGSKDQHLPDRQGNPRHRIVDPRFQLRQSAARRNYRSCSFRLASGDRQ